MEIEVGHALAPSASPGVSRASLEKLDRLVAEAHERIEHGIETSTHGFAALDLGDRVDPTAMSEASSALAGGGPLLIVGMGGSALGARAVAMALSPDCPCYVLDTIDPVVLSRHLSTIDLESTSCHVVSRSGSTVETRATFHVVREAMEAAGVDWRERTIATTPADGPLGEQIEAAGVPRLDPPEGVPGRYSVLSSMALPGVAALGVDIEGLLTGARRARASFAPSLFACPAYAYGAITAALAARGVSQNVFLPYAEDLQGLAEWFRQLWSESLGKDGLGQTPIAGRGIADHHSQLQRWRHGPRNLALTVVSTPSEESVSVPDTDNDLAGVDLGRLIALERRSVEAALARDGRPWVRFDPGGVTAETVGELFVTLEAACIMHAQLAGVNPFDQPAVEWSKRAVAEELGGEETERTRALAETDGLRISD